MQARNGAIQSSVLAPLLFLIEINDITKNLKDVETAIFADDTSICKTGICLKYTLKIIQRALKDTEKWTEAWGFRVSDAKTAVVVFDNNRINLDRKLKCSKQALPTATQ
jgi:hypothetical protein